MYERAAGLVCSRPRHQASRQPAVTLGFYYQYLDHLQLKQSDNQAANALGFRQRFFQLNTQSGDYCRAKRRRSIFSHPAIEKFEPSGSAEYHHRFNQSALDYLNAVKSQLENNPINHSTKTSPEDAVSADEAQDASADTNALQKKRKHQWQ
jgi:hypothetical protein